MTDNPGTISNGSSDIDLDHIVPKSKGGADTNDNIQLLCGRATARRATGR